MRHGGIVLGTLALCVAGAAHAGEREVRYTEVPSWVVPAPTPTDSETPDGASYRVIYSDIQMRLGADGLEAFQGYRVKILRPDALAAGNITLSWYPDAGDAKIHYARIIRDNEVIDILKSTNFQILQREGFLERAALNGELTAALQTPGLQVGDELEFAATVRRKDPTLGDHLFGFGQLPPAGGQGVFRMRMVWPKSRGLRWRASSDLTGIAPKTTGDQVELVYQLRDPRPVTVADGAPNRVNVRRFVEVSDFQKWSDVSERMWPMYEKASTLAPDSSLRKEIAHISATESDPIRRMRAALGLVQDRIRYVTGNYAASLLKGGTRGCRSGGGWRRSALSRVWG